jgi:hypothetical protein
MASIFFVYSADSSLHFVAFRMTGLSVKRGKGEGNGGCAATAFSPLTLKVPVSVGWFSK